MTIHREELPPIYGFVNGYRTEDEPSTIEVLKAWRAAGEPLANHTWSHADLDDTSSDQFILNIQANQPLLRALMPAPSDDWHWFRYPYLNEGKTLEKHREVRGWLKDNHYRVVEVTLDLGRLGLERALYSLLGEARCCGSEGATRFLPEHG